LNISGNFLLLYVQIVGKKDDKTLPIIRLRHVFGTFTAKRLILPSVWNAAHFRFVCGMPKLEWWSALADSCRKCRKWAANGPSAACYLGITF